MRFRICASCRCQCPFKEAAKESILACAAIEKFQMADAGVLLSQVGVIQNVFPYTTLGNTYLTCWQSLEKELLQDSKDFSTLFQPVFSEANIVTDDAFQASQF
jgi:hypothetical protein